MKAMNRIIKNMPLPIAGLILSMAVMGNILEDIHVNIRYVYGVTAAVLMLVLILKILFYRETTVKELENPLILTVFPTFDMGLMVLATYISRFHVTAAFYIWVFAVFIHFCWIIYVTKKLFLNFDMNKIFPSIFVTYVGIVTASVTAPVFKMQTLGQYIFYFGFISYLLLIIIVFFRMVKIKGIPEPAFPAGAILAAPASLCLAGYISSFKDKNEVILYFLLGLSLFMTFFVLFFFYKFHTKKFYPSFSAFTFPFVISTLALKSYIKYLNTHQGTGSMIFSKELLTGVYYFELILSVAAIFYVLIRYVMFFKAKFAVVRESE